MSKSDKWSLCKICNRRAPYGNRICKRERCKIIFDVLSHTDMQAIWISSKEYKTLELIFTGE